MASSRRRVPLLVGIAAVLASFAACDSLIGLGQYSVVPADAAADSTGGGTSDALDENDSTTNPLDAGPGDAGDASDVTVVDATPEAAPPPDVSVDAPSLVTLWAQWPMPNPDAAIAPDSGTLLPNQMAYDLGPDGGSTTAYDTVTKLTWLRAPESVTSYAEAVNYCVPKGFAVPTRIQLVSLIDFTQGSVTINPSAFSQVMGVATCTSSVVITDGAPTANYWTVNFNTATTSTTAPCSQVLCVEGP
jgi:hypothetical protein